MDKRIRSYVEWLYAICDEHPKERLTNMPGIVSNAHTKDKLEKLFPDVCITESMIRDVQGI